MEPAQSTGSLNLQDRQEHFEYFENEVRPIFAALMVSVAKSKPEDIFGFCTKWFKERRGDPNRLSEGDHESDVESDLFVSIPDSQFRPKLQEKLKKRKKRVGVTSEVYGPCARRHSIKMPVGVQKAEQTHMRILFFCMGSFLFKSFSESEMGVLIKMMVRRVTKTNELVFKEGEWGDCIYFVDEGVFECTQGGEQAQRSIRYYHVGDTFGQICLLHFIKRQASIYSRSQGILYSLNRECYIHYKKMCITKRRAIYTYALKKQQFFTGFSEEELEKICDVLTEISYEEGEIIINEGDVGSKFYIILDGILVAFKGQEENIVQCYKEGDAFGQIALIKDTPRQASVKSLTRSKLVFLTQETFLRIFQNVNLDKEIEEKYGVNRNNLVTRRRENADDYRADKNRGELSDDS